MSEIMQLTVNGMWTQFIKPLRERLPFRTYGNLHGCPGAATSIGRLPAMFRTSVAEADYVVYS
jgi:hypothetical protein